MNNINKRMLILEAYALISLVVFGVLSVSAFVQTKQTYDEISVGRLNIVEKNGQLRAVIANTDRMPDPIIDGKAFKTERPPGMIFYNGLGDECGGLIFGAIKGGDKYGAVGELLFDQYRQSQIVNLGYNDHNGSREAGLSILDRPETPEIDLLQRYDAVAKLPEGPDKEAAKRSLRAADFHPTRVFVGKDKEREAKVTLYDAKGTARINMIVEANGTPRLDFLDESGKVTYSLPGDARKSGQN